MKRKLQAFSIGIRVVTYSSLRKDLHMRSHTLSPTSTLLKLYWYRPLNKDFLRRNVIWRSYIWHGFRRASRWISRTLDRKNIFAGRCAHVRRCNGANEFERQSRKKRERLKKKRERQRNGGRGGETESRKSQGEMGQANEWVE